MGFVVVMFIQLVEIRRKIFRYLRAIWCFYKMFSFCRVSCFNFITEVGWLGP